ncbi:Hypothetical predicted protein, partial [Prunus dulcis]
GDVEDETVGESMVDFGIIIELIKIRTGDSEFRLCVPYVRDKETGVSTNNQEQAQQRDTYLLAKMTCILDI